MMKALKILVVSGLFISFLFIPSRSSNAIDYSNYYKYFKFRMVFLLYSPCSRTGDAPSLLMNAMCSRMAACCSGGACAASLDACSRAMEGEAGRQIWDDFGLETHENEWTAGDLRSRISSGVVRVNNSYLCSCIDDFLRVSCSDMRLNYSTDYFNMENIIPESGSWCPAVFSAS